MNARRRGEVEMGKVTDIVMAGKRDGRRVLVIHDSQAACRLLALAIKEKCGRRVETATTLARARTLLEGRDGMFLAAVVGLELPDASGSQVVEFVLAHGLPTVVLSGSWKEETRAEILSYPIFDYFIKDAQGISEACRAINRIPRNCVTKVLVVDDSETSREYQAALLHAHRFQVFKAENGEEALLLLDQHPDTTVVITDCEMPGMDGPTLAARIRKSRTPDELAIVGVSAHGSSATAVRFLKQGASDFLSKPFEKEEFYCRIYNCVDMIENARAIRAAAFIDPLTGLPNRLSFFSRAPSLFDNARRSGEPLAVAMVDIDFFKRVNDSYGHGAGDEVLRRVAAVLEERMGNAGLVARFGGEEFCFLCRALEPDSARTLFEGVREAVEGLSVRHGSRTIRVTISVGVALRPLATLDETIGEADRLLYEAKHAGRNRVVMGDTELTGSGGA